MQADYDLIIVGAGLAGNALVLALQGAGLRIAVIESASEQALRQSQAGDRALALAAGTVGVLQSWGAWQGVADKATAIKHIHVSDQGHFGKTRLSAENEGVDALGYVIAARDLEGHLAQLVDASSVDCFYDTRLVGLVAGNDAMHVALKQQGQSLNLSAALVVGADGGQSSVRQLLEIPQQVAEYGQTALVTTVQAALSHQNRAYERFTASGPLALLPMAGRQLSVVWTRSDEQAVDLMASGEAYVMAELQASFGYRLGLLKPVAPCRAFPLRLIRADRMIAPRAVIIGNAAHQLHPVAGQGFNLGLRDGVQLADMLLQQHQAGADIGDAAFLKRYARLRQSDHAKTIQFTHQLVQIFSTDWLPVAAARNTGLVVLDHLPFAKHWLVRHAMGLAQGLSR